MNWQPIETAPKDRSIFLAVHNFEGLSTPQYVITRWGFYDYAEDQEHYQDFSESGGECWVQDCGADLESGYNYKFEPTHWTPLPELPEEYK